VSICFTEETVREKPICWKLYIIVPLAGPTGFSNDANVVRNGETTAVSAVHIRNILGRRDLAVRFHPDGTQKKEILIDQKKINKFSDMMGCLRCVIFFSGG
jgi:hypothetical protein